MTSTQDHKSWLDNEYSQWVKALQESTVHNFKEHPMVKRMLGVKNFSLRSTDAGTAFGEHWHLMCKIDSIGYSDEGNSDLMVSKDGIYEDENADRGSMLRYIYYANQILKLNPSSICEIGGGVGQFYAILRALGYKGTYKIVDKSEVIQFVNKYLDEVEKQTGLNLNMGADGNMGSEMVVSFYALGEFDDQTKADYFRTIINNTKHGYIAWNAHSGASDDLSLFKHDIKVTPGIEEGIKIIQW